ncbi:MAG: cytochrome c3 family protein [Rubrivivax sp.]|nr:cytochrome c3 family protein [Rubrivivax sp.]
MARHDVLTFFFTGVPPLGEEEHAAQPVAQVAPKLAGQPAARTVRVVQATRYGHGPYAANLCFACHQVSGSGGFRGFGKQDEAKGAIAQAGQVSGKLLAPMGELCSGCHTSQSPAKAQAAGLWVHGPVSTGYCVLCHAPHAAPEPFLLQKASDALCAECHTPAQLVSRAAHEGRTDCVSCHSAHMGKDSRMLKAEYREAR